MIDNHLADYDASIIEHIVVDAPREVVHKAARNMDFLDVHTPAIDTLMFVRALPGRLRKRRGRRPAPPAPTAIRLADMFDRSSHPQLLDGWVGLAEEPGRELVFGAIGKVWKPDIEWRSVTAEEFRTFAEPDFAKIAARFSVRDYGQGRTLLTYEARTVGTNTEARRKFRRYRWLVRRFVRIVMRAAVFTIKDRAEHREPWPPLALVSDPPSATG